jgi:predicted metal-dependent phosphoesterase TrpH
MRTRSGPLLAELHAHTTWSDGDLSIPRLVDVYGSRGYDVLCITDHVTRGAADPFGTPGVTADAFPGYLDELEREGRRAAETFGMLLLPGLELSWNDLDPDNAAHAVAVGLRRHVSLEDGLEVALEEAAGAGAALVAAHPFADEPDPVPERRTRRFSQDPSLRRLVHRYELFNRTTLFGWVAAEGLPAVATGDFHRLEHLAGWKTMIPCAREPEAIVAYLRSRLPVFLARLGDQPARLAA